MAARSLMFSMVRKLSLVACYLLCIASLSNAQTVDLPTLDEPIFVPIDAAELMQRYPVGKKWRSLSVFRGDGTGTSTNWGLTGEVHLILMNRYMTEVEITNSVDLGRLSEISLRCQVLDASSSRVVTRQRLRLADFEVEDPLFELAAISAVKWLRTVAPPIDLLIRVGETIEGVDQNLERTLTGVADRIGLSPDSLNHLDDLKLVENPSSLARRTFDVTWTNGFGVTRITEVKQEGDDRPQLDVNKLRQWSVGADPLADLYVFPSLSKRHGSKWTLDASRAASIFCGRGDAVTRGEVELRYERDGEYAGTKARYLRIVSGNVSATVESVGQRTQYNIDSMTGQMRVAGKDAMLLMANGSGDISYSRISTDHILFGARLSRDFRSQWRYEAMRIEK